jgi:hypothetical protein
MDSCAAGVRPAALLEGAPRAALPDRPAARRPCRGSTGGPRRRRGRAGTRPPRAARWRRRGSTGCGSLVAAVAGACAAFVHASGRRRGPPRRPPHRPVPGPRARGASDQRGRGRGGGRRRMRAGAVKTNAGCPEMPAPRGAAGAWGPDAGAGRRAAGRSSRAGTRLSERRAAPATPAGRTPAQAERSRHHTAAGVGTAMPGAWWGALAAAAGGGRSLKGRLPKKRVRSWSFGAQKDRSKQGTEQAAGTWGRVVGGQQMKRQQAGRAHRGGGGALHGKMRVRPGAAWGSAGGRFVLYWRGAARGRPPYRRAGRPTWSANWPITLPAGA